MKLSVFLRQPVTLCGSAARGESHGWPGPVPALPRIPWGKGSKPRGAQRPKRQQHRDPLGPLLGWLRLAGLTVFVAKRSEAFNESTGTDGASWDLMSSVGTDLCLAFM